MKLIRFGDDQKEKTGVVINGKRLDTTSFGEAYDERFFETNGLSRLESFVKENLDVLSTVPEGLRLGCPISRPSKLVCIGLNYKDHAEETGAKLPEEPIIFMKSTSAIVGPNDNVILPKGSKKTDWEVEFCIVIGKKAQYVDESDAEQYIAGYMLHNDISERAYQLERGGTWDKGKGCDTFAPCGPYLVTCDEIEDIHNLDMSLSVNGHLVQKGNTRNLIFNVPYIVSYVSQFMTLLPGDIISTGTPAGVALGMKNPKYLKPEDIMELDAGVLGSQKQRVIAYKPL